MKTDRFLKQPSKNSGNSSQQGRDAAESVALTGTQAQHIQSSTLRPVTVHAKGLVFGVALLQDIALCPGLCCEGRARMKPRWVGER
ncbi:hypothetical protein F7725_011360 [Dissostichus mawsoni]|uniref:Uncharacterized protein n=1 Tax=Dissostichus mawsoni TaxID=36200 RepID=A0A7J5ZAS1_DISMA|nr:hypothetical protein F7725_011360 [Dissostichus mawsoni]